VTEEAQARYVASALARARTAWPWLGPLFWPALCPARPATDPWRGFALCAGDGTWRPVADVLAPATAPTDWLPPGRHSLAHPALRFSPAWRVTSLAADPSADGDTLTFDFWGSALALRVQGGPYWAYYRITVDAAPANALPRDESGAAYLVLHDPLTATRWVTIAHNLPPGRHAVRLETVGGWGQWALQGIAVTLASAARPILPWTLAGLAALVTAAWAFGRHTARGRGDSSAGALRSAASEHRSFLKGLAASACSLMDQLATRLPGWSAWGLALLLVAALMLSRQFAVDLAALAGLGLLFIVRPDLSLPLVAAALPFWQQPEQLLNWEFGHFELFLWVAVAALAVRWALRRIADRGPQGSDPGLQGPACGGPSPASTLRALDYPILALLFAGLASTLMAAEQGVAWREFRIVFLFGAVFYGLIICVPGPAGRAFSWRPLVAGLLLGMALAGAIGLWQLITGQGRVDVEGVWRVRALYGSPNNLALILDRGVPLALALALAPSLRAPSSLRKRVGVGAWAITLLLALACVATFSKGALLLGLPAGLAVVLIGGTWRSGRRWPLWLLAGLAVFGAAGLALLFRTQRFADLLNFEAGTSFLRLKLWQGAWQMALDHPVLGVGPDNFLYAYRTRYVLPSAWQELNLSHPHNILLDLWTRLGLAGVVVGSWALVAAWRATWHQFRAGAADTWPLALGLLAGLAATVAHGLIDNSLFLPDLMGLFVIAAGLLRRMEG